jgi:hypothetical protein
MQTRGIVSTPRELGTIGKSEDRFAVVALLAPVPVGDYRRLRNIAHAAMNVFVPLISASTAAMSRRNGITMPSEQPFQDLIYLTKL